MNPLVTALLVLGYGLSVPIGFRLRKVVKNQHRMAFTGHQVGIIIAAVGWLLKGSFFVAFAHVLWLIGTRIWFQFRGSRSKQNAPPVSQET